MTKKQKKHLTRIIVALVIYVAVLLLPIEQPVPEPYAIYAELVLFAIPYLIAGYDVLYGAFLNIKNGHMLDEDFLMSIATLGAFALVLFPEAEQHFAEGAAVMLFFQVGEFFENYAVGKTRNSIADMMDIAPEFATLEIDGELEEVDPEEVEPGSVIVVKSGERVPLDGIVLDGTSQLDTSALTGESAPRSVAAGDEIISGCVNLTGVLRVQTTKPYGDSTVSRILELVENASEKKARTENFITRFARYYTPAVVACAVLLAVLPPLLTGAAWSDWIQRGLIFLVVSCPCALVISVPLSFFGGIGSASRAGILVKGSNYLEMLANVDTVVFDKTGTITTGKFGVTEIHPANNMEPQQLLMLAAQAEQYSTHPIARAIVEACETKPAADAATNVEEVAGKGITALLESKQLLAGNAALMEANGLPVADTSSSGTIVHVAYEGRYCGYLAISDMIKADAAEAISALHNAGVKQAIMLTGDRQSVAKSVANELGLDSYRAELLPQDKVSEVEKLLAAQPEKHALAFVGDGINDAPVLTRADVGIAMGAMGSDAAIEAADIVLMDDAPSKIATAMRIARGTVRIVWQNVIFAIGVKFVILILAAIGIANMWLAVFGDVGVAVLAILNAMRALRIK